MTQKVIQLTLDNCCSWGVSMPKSGMLFSVIFISSAISALTPEMQDMEAISGAATGDNTTETEVPNNDQFILSKYILSTGRHCFVRAGVNGMLCHALGGAVILFSL